MSSLKIYIHPNFSPKITSILYNLHDLQKVKKYEIIKWQNLDEDKIDLKTSIFLMTDKEKKGLSVSTLKHHESGYRIVACKLPKEKYDFFELGMSVLRVWPYIIEKSMKEDFLFTFKYGGKRLSGVKLKNI
jgi:hypothetical protein